MKLNTIMKSMAIITGIFLLNVICFAESLIGLSFSSESPLIKTICVFIIIVDVVLTPFLVYVVISYDNTHAFDGVIVPDKEEDYADTLKKNNRKDPLLDQKIEDAIDQMERVDEKLKILENILTRNKAAFPSLLQTGQEAKTAIFSNIRTVVNSACIWDTRIKRYSKEDVHEELIDDIQNALNANEDILYKVDMFLREAAKLKGDITDNDPGLEAAISTLQDLRKISLLYNKGDNQK